MKIGIIGINMYPKQLNFACGLHTFAFQQFLLQNNIESEVIDYKPVYFNNFDMAHPADYYQRLYDTEKNTFADTPQKQQHKEERLAELQVSIDAWKALYTERENRYYKFQSFLDKYYIKTPEQYDSDLLEVKDPGFDCYMCVTDVIWKVLPTHIYDRGFLLGSKCMDNKQKISYAASRGVAQPYSKKEHDLFFKYINDIDIISVREKSTQEFIEANSNKKATLVLDPVLLHDKSFWKKYSVKPKEENYILLYYVMEKAADTIRYAVEYAKRNNLLIVELSDIPEKNGRVHDPNVKHIALHDVGMEEWLGYIEHANCIFTNSFHGCCFSIIFEKLFYVGKRKGDKVTNILDTLDLNSLLLANYKKPKKLSFIMKINNKIFKTLTHKELYSIFKDVPKKIDYSKVTKILEEKRLESQQFILDAISIAENNIKQHNTKSIETYDKYRRNLTYPINYNSGISDVKSNYDSTRAGYSLKNCSAGTIELTNSKILCKNNGTSLFLKNHFKSETKSFVGWNLRFKIDNRWFWILEDDSIIPESELTKDMKKKLFADESVIPYIPVNNIRIAVAEANWS